MKIVFELTFKGTNYSRLDLKLYVREFFAPYFLENLPVLPRKAH